FSSGVSAHEKQERYERFGLVYLWNFFVSVDVFSGQFSFWLIPKRVEVKPIVRCKARIMLKALGIAFHPKVNIFGAASAIQDDLVGKLFEVNFIVVPAAIQAKKQNNGRTHRGSKQDRTRWKRRGRAEKLTMRCFIAARNAIA